MLTAISLVDPLNVSFTELRGSLCAPFPGRPRPRIDFRHRSGRAGRATRRCARPWAKSRRYSRGQEAKVRGRHPAVAFSEVTIAVKGFEPGISARRQVLGGSWRLKR